MKYIFLFFLLSGEFALAQTGMLTGVVKDELTNETLIGANVTYAEGKGTITDIDGNYKLELPYGDYTLTVSYAGYKKFTIPVSVKSKSQKADIKLKNAILNEIEIVADIAIGRETPVAFTNVSPIKIQEELASQDLPMLLNTTPGIYATQQGGGDGDARVTIRGFSQRNIAVMVDGIPVNDMENGWVYWSNWFGLDGVTKTMQVQRGLGASKIAIPSVGGTINILTKGIDNKRGGSIKQEIGNNNFLRTTVGWTSGKLKGDWGVTLAGSYKNGDGWVDKTFTKGWFYYLKVEKKIKKHRLGLSMMGAPQSHGQRSFKNSSAVYNRGFAQDLGVDTEGIPERGIAHNEHWGEYEEYYINTVPIAVPPYLMNDTVSLGKRTLNERVNYYHKPLFSFRHFWEINEKTYLSNIAYLSIGNGGGTRLFDSPSSEIGYTSDGQLDFQSIYNTNALSSTSLDPAYSSTHRKSTNYLLSSVNNHNWVGLLSTLHHTINDQLDLSGGVDLRDYVGGHYREVYDLIGGDYAVNNDDANQESAMKRVGDKIGYHNDGLVRWGGLFGQLEYKDGLWAGFFSVSSAVTGYNRTDYFREKIEGEFETTGWKYIPGYTIKTGANYNLTERQNIFLNVGHLNKAPRFQNVIDFGNQFFTAIENEKVNAVELGYSYHSHKFSANINTYYTSWQNKPYNNGVTYENAEGVQIRANVNGMDALHYGIETDFIYKIHPDLEFEGLVSLGDWTWNSDEEVLIYDDNSQTLLGTQEFYAKGVHVGDAAQFQFSGSLKYTFHRGFYVKARATHFGKNYSEINPFALAGKDAHRESWRMPNYYLMDIHFGYRFNVNQTKMSLRGSILNAMNTIYISDATNNFTSALYVNSADFDANSAAVFFGQGRRFNVSLRVEF